MALMLSKTYDAFVAAGAPADKAREAAEEIAALDKRLDRIDRRLAILDTKTNIMMVILLVIVGVVIKQLVVGP